MTNPQQAVKNRAASYALRRGCKLLETPLGVGKDGIVFATSVATAIKAHRAPSSFRRELSCYQRLFEHHVLEVCGHAVPQLLNWSDELLTIEMTIVTRPFLLDFSDAWLDDAPEFSDEAISLWHTEGIERFGEDRWERVLTVASTM